MENLEQIEEVVEVKSSTELKGELWSKVQDTEIACRNKIVNDCIWKGKPVYLSETSQLNIKDKVISVNLGIKTLPVKIYINDGEHEFKTKEELNDFYVTTTNHIDLCVKESRDAKIAINEEYSVLISSAIARETAEQQTSEVAS